MSAWEQSVGRSTLKSYLFEEEARRPIKMILHVVHFDIGLSRWSWNRFALTGHPSPYESATQAGNVASV